MTILLPLLAFAFGSLLIMSLAAMLSPSETVTLERRLSEVSGPADEVKTPAHDRMASLVALFKRLGGVAPKSEAELGKLRQRLVTAGYRSREALIVFLGIRLAAAVGAFLLFVSPLIKRPNLFVACGACGIAYVMAGMALARRAKQRQHLLQLGLPDVLDLLVVSVEAGLGLDQALQRVGEELASAHPDLSEELRIVNLEMRAGTERIEALRNLATRVDLEDVSSLVTMLVQTEKFGTSVAQSLRVHSDSLRTKRRQRAEEAAAKTGAKMVFPLAVCIFPAIWVVTLGPAAIRFVKVLVPLVKK